MEKEFIPHQQSIDLEGLGFDEPSLKENTTFHFKNDTFIFSDGGILYQQAFRWFREKYDLVSWVRRRPGFVKEYSWYVSDFNDEDPDEYYFDLHIETYEEAELECLKKLIEIVKEKK